MEAPVINLEEVMRPADGFKPLARKAVAKRIRALNDEAAAVEAAAGPSREERARARHDAGLGTEEAVFGALLSGKQHLD